MRARESQTGDDPLKEVGPLAIGNRTHTQIGSLGTLACIDHAPVAFLSLADHVSATSQLPRLVARGTSAP